MDVYKGLPTSRGVVIGTVRIADKYADLDVPFHKICDSDIAHEIERFQIAVTQVRTDLECTIQEVTRETSADVFAVHLMITQDDAFNKGVILQIRQKKQNVESILKEVIEEFSRMFQQLQDPYAREKAADIRDVGERVLHKLLFVDTSATTLPDQGKYLVFAHDLTPMVTVHLQHSSVLGFIAETGSTASHGSILARSMGVPAVVNLGKIRHHLIDGDDIIVDGIEGKVFLRPTDDIKEQYQHAIAHFQSEQKELLRDIHLPARTQDGIDIELKSNIGNVVDLELSTDYGAEGVGLYRTEFPFLELDRFPTEDEQFESYKTVIEKNRNYEVNLRVLDLGGDKFLPYMELPKQDNPHLGWRGMRVLLKNPTIFRPQIRAILRASWYGSVTILLPMVTALEEVRAAKDLIEEERDLLLKEGYTIPDAIKIGVMIEVPASVFIIDQILAEVDFISVGTNDLVQYILAVDRNVGTVSDLYNPLHPAVLHALKILVDAAKRHKKSITICGEMAGNAEYIGILVGLGYRSFSITPRSIPLVKKTIRLLNTCSCSVSAKSIFQCATIAEVHDMLQQKCKCGCCTRTSV